MLYSITVISAASFSALPGTIVGLTIEPFLSKRIIAYVTGVGIILETVAIIIRSQVDKFLERDSSHRLFKIRNSCLGGFVFGVAGGSILRQNLFHLISGSKSTYPAL
eukprot:gb/GECH01004218.1/.p1 GENE.gb/GECH01004218.1/~~gb/GECH01004218.1/.p1  ORF type:complete len:107 (+),score=18.56 gb/GECH01004218.1/:1-321(+)